MKSNISIFKVEKLMHGVLSDFVESLPSLLHFRSCLPLVLGFHIFLDFSSDMSPHTWIYYAKISEKLVPGVSGSNPSANMLTKCDRFQLNYDFLALFLTKTYFALDLVTELAKNLKLFKKVSISSLCKSMKLLCIS